MLSKSHENMSDLLNNFDKYQFSVDIISKKPEITGLSWDKNLEPKLKYYQKIFSERGYLWKNILPNPSMLTYSLEKRIKPRTEMTKGLDLGDGSKYLSLIRMGQKQFDKTLKNYQINNQKQ